MSDIRQWLDELGLGQYADAFEANEIGVDLLSRLTDEALEKLGVEEHGPPHPPNGRHRRTSG